MNRVLVTGGAGYIGSHTSLLLLQEGYEIIIVDSLINSSVSSIEKIIEICSKNNLEINKKIHFFKLDLRNENSLSEIFYDFQNKGKPIESVIHFAGLKAVGDSVKNPISYWDSNVNGTINLLKVMEKFDCKTIVFSSSATIYEYAKDAAIREDAKIYPTNPYGSTKASIEKLLDEIFYSSPKQWRISDLRYFNPIGAHPSGIIGENPLGLPDNIFPFISQVALGKLKELRIFGNDWPTHDGTAVRDYIHIMDLAEGHVKTLNYLLRIEPQVLKFNLGTGKGTSVLELLNIFKKVNNLEVPYVFTDRREGDIASIIADNTLAISSLKWTPKKTLEDMCRDEWKWRSMNPNGYLKT